MVNFLKLRTLVACQNGLKQCRPRSGTWVFPVCYSDKHFVTSSPENQYFFLRTEREKVFKILEHLHTLFLICWGLMPPFQQFSQWSSVPLLIFWTIGYITHLHFIHLCIANWVFNISNKHFWGILVFQLGIFVNVKTLLTNWYILCLIAAMYITCCSKLTLFSQIILKDTENQSFGCVHLATSS